MSSDSTRAQVSPEEAERCPNCGCPVTDAFCAHCGQKRGHLHVSFGHLLHELADDFFHVDSKLPRTLGHLLRPGFLTREYLAGRRARYVGPFKLYLVVSVIYFFAWMVATTPATEQTSRSAELTAPLQVNPTPKPPEPQAGLDGSTKASSSLSDKLAARVERLGMLVQANPRQVRERFQHLVVSFFPKAMFLLMPFFALLLKLLYRKSVRTFPEHFIFALHFHTVCFVALGIDLLPLPELVEDILVVAVLGYLLVALKNLFAQSWPKTLGKLALLAATYGCGLLVFFATVGVWFVWTS